MQRDELSTARALGWVSLFTDTASAMVAILMPIFVLDVLGESPAELGLVVAVGTFVSFALRYLAGVASDWTGRPKRFASFGYVLSALAKPALALAGSWLTVAAVRVMDRLGKALRAAPRDALIAESAGARANRAFALHKAMDLAGEALGLAVVAGAFLWLATPQSDLVRSLIALTLLPGVLAVVILVVAVPESPSAAKKTGQRALITQTRLPSGLLWLAAFALILVEQPLLVGRLTQLGMPMPQLAGLVFLGHLASIAVARRFGSSTAIAYRSRPIAAWIVLTATTATLLLIINSPATVALALIVGQAALTTVLLAARSGIAHFSTAGRGSTYGAFFFLFAVFGATGAALAGYLWDRFGFPSIGLAFALPCIVIGVAVLAQTDPTGPSGTGVGDSKLDN